ncbi:MAG: hypothetical protein AAF514_16250, partial [Verrucomicrobiota bacterium]
MSRFFVRMFFGLAFPLLVSAQPDRETEWSALERACEQRLLANPIANSSFQMLLERHPYGGARDQLKDRWQSRANGEENSSAYRVLTGLLAREEHNFARAETWFRKAGDDFHARYHLARLLSEGEREEEAINELRKAIALASDPDLLRRALDQLSRHFENAGHWNRVSQLWNEAWNAREAPEFRFPLVEPLVNLALIDNLFGALCSDWERRSREHWPYHLYLAEANRLTETWNAAEKHMGAIPDKEKRHPTVLRFLRRYTDSLERDDDEILVSLAMAETNSIGPADLKRLIRHTGRSGKPPVLTRRIEALFRSRPELVLDEPLYWLDDLPENHVGCFLDILNARLERHPDDLEARFTRAELIFSANEGLEKRFAPANRGSGAKRYSRSPTNLREEWWAIFERASKVDLPLSHFEKDRTSMPSIPFEFRSEPDEDADVDYQLSRSLPDQFARTRLPSSRPRSTIRNWSNRRRQADDLDTSGELQWVALRRLVELEDPERFVARLQKHFEANEASADKRVLAWLYLDAETHLLQEFLKTPPGNLSANLVFHTLEMLGSNPTRRYRLSVREQDQLVLRLRHFEKEIGSLANEPRYCALYHIIAVLRAADLPEKATRRLKDAMAWANQDSKSAKNGARWLATALDFKREPTATAPSQEDSATDELTREWTQILRQRVRLMPNGSGSWQIFDKPLESLLQGETEDSPLPDYAALGRYHVYPLPVEKTRSAPEPINLVELAASLKDLNEAQRLRAALCQALIVEQNSRKRIESLEELNREHPDDPAIVFSLLELYLREGRPEQILTPLRHLSTLETPWGRDAGKLLIVLLMKYGAEEEARQRWETIKPELRPTSENQALTRLLRMAGLPEEEARLTSLSNDAVLERWTTSF